MAKVIDKPTTIKRPIKRPIKTPDEYNDLVILQRIVVNANRIGDLEYAEMAQARIDYLNSVSGAAFPHIGNVRVVA
jgi:hypothetical protein